MSKFDAQRALTIYKTFAKLTSLTVEFLGVARNYEHATRLEIPKLKHAPTSLTSSLEEYLNDEDFEVNRRQYLAHQGVKQDKKPNINGGPSSVNAFKKQDVNSGVKTGASSQSKAAQNAAPAPALKAPAPDLIDFFSSIEQDQQPMVIQSQPQPQNFQNSQQTGFQQIGYAPQQPYYSQSGQQPQYQQPNGGGFDHSNPFGQPQQQQQHQQQSLQPSFTGAEFGGYNPQPSQQQDSFSSISQPTGSSFPSQQQAFSTGQTSFAPTQPSFNTGQSQNQSTNPFRQSMFPNATGNSMPPLQQGSTPSMPSAQSPQSTNPFARSATMPTTGQDNNSPFGSQAPVQPQNTPFNSPPPQQTYQPPAQQMTPQRTGTNPFARATPQPQSPPTAQPLIATPTGSTNPFRQSVFTNQQTGQGWQGSQGTMGGLEQLPTMPVFPRLGQQQPLPQQQNPWS